MDERNFQYMFYGFAAAWTILVVYVLSLVARESRLRREMDTIRKMISDKESHA